jgi:NADH dehydrogenase
MSETHVVTGAFGFTGRYVAQRLLDSGRRVVTLTGKPATSSPFGDRVEARPFTWGDPARLAESLRGASVLYNTYWVRFNWGEESYDRAVANTRTLFRAAQEAGVRRVVHVSITNPSEGSPFPYFRGKAVLERELRESGLAHAILRPAVVFGPGDVLVNNIAWIARRFPFFVVPGRGGYRLQPIFVDDLAALAVDAGGRADDFTVDAIGPETFTFEDLVRLVARTVGRRARIVHASPRVALGLTDVLGKLVRDVVLTRDEIAGLMADLLVTNSPPAGATRLSEWLPANANGVGRRYASELARHFRPTP